MSTEHVVLTTFFTINILVMIFFSYIIVKFLKRETEFKNIIKNLNIRLRSEIQHSSALEKEIFKLRR
jgi:hypothetical protein